MGGLSPLQSCRRMLRSGRGMKMIRMAAILAMMALLGGCGAAALPCRVASAGIKAVPIVGGVASAPTDACAGAIDP